jgi:glycosyltransferase involved in cell wall biosynthesis
MASDLILTVLMPVRNDGINLRIMLKMLRAVVDVPYEVVIVHDTPDDDSVRVVEELPPGQPVRAVHNTLGRGVVNAIRSGVAAAAGRYVLIFAADEVGPVLAIEDMLALMESGCEFVSCTRYAHGGRRLGGSLVGGILSRIANRLFRWLAGSLMTDCTTGIKMFRRDQFDRFNLESRPIGWAVAFEMAIKAQLLGLSLGEVPIVSIDRLYGGQSTFRLGPWTGEYMRWFLWGLTRTRRSQVGRHVQVRIPASTALGGKA